MKKMSSKTSIRSFIIGILSVSALLVLSSCRMPQTEPTLLLNVPYHDARKVIVQSGWKPAEIKRDEYDDTSSISHFLDLGYTEVAACSGTGKGYCRFIFRNNLGLYLEITTQEAPFGGDRVNIKNWDDAVVINYGITDKINH